MASPGECTRSAHLDCHESSKPDASISQPPDSRSRAHSTSRARVPADGRPEFLENRQSPWRAPNYFASNCLPRKSGGSTF